MVALVVVPAVLQAPGDSGLGASNCGFLTIEQCRATVSGIGGFCVPNQFYNPMKTATGPRKQREVRGYQMPYDPYPWCAEYSEKGVILGETLSKRPVSISELLPVPSGFSPTLVLFFVACGLATAFVIWEAPVTANALEASQL